MAPSSPAATFLFRCACPTHPRSLQFLRDTRPRTNCLKILNMTYLVVKTFSDTLLVSRVTVPREKHLPVKEDQTYNFIASQFKGAEAHRQRGSCDREWKCEAKSKRETRIRSR
ncbi:hypothetical protein HYPSUDRAFT_224542 [Hypholoma sublateritium FD-334 SS-4]|uniref:Uncharacterized protein n=1 Tax=Hypholoma sublateritium (strain FD-334 SS-4) TaxID=945553 RepID=A0A0D2QDD1_HYPSF|nr:hypothetical protein HYPSUDRAFT_224542 [Hypholoma sublateritium FD-334 SS-4]